MIDYLDRVLSSAERVVGAPSSIPDSLELEEAEATIGVNAPSARSASRVHLDLPIPPPQVHQMVAHEKHKGEHKEKRKAEAPLEEAMVESSIVPEKATRDADFRRPKVDPEKPLARAEIQVVATSPGPRRVADSPQIPVRTPPAHPSQPLAGICRDNAPEVPEAEDGASFPILKRRAVQPIIVTTTPALNLNILNTESAKAQIPEEDADGVDTTAGEWERPKTWALPAEANVETTVPQLVIGNIEIEVVTPLTVPPAPPNLPEDERPAKNAGAWSSPARRYAGRL